MKVGFIGLGHMGAPMSRNVLAAGHELVVHDVRPDAAAGLLAAGASWAGSPREAGADRDAVITMLPGPTQVEEVLLGPGGLLAGLAAGATWIDMSTSIPAVADKVRAVAGPGHPVLDAPVAGGITGASGRHAADLRRRRHRGRTCGCGRCWRSWGTGNGSCMSGRTAPGTPSS